MANGMQGAAVAQAHVTLRPLVKEHRDRRCDTCSEPYWRRNLTEVWTVRNTGHRRGWQKVVVRQCMNCQTTEQSQRVLVAAQVAWTPRVVAKRAEPPTKAAREMRRAQRGKR